MLKIIDKSKCTGCHSCFSVCPKQCIKMTEDQEGFLYPTIDEDKCVNCGLCEKACPIITPLEVTNKEAIAYSAISKDEDTRMKSSSGGIFTELAKRVIEKNGVVFGAGFDCEMNVVHSYTTTKEGLEKFRGSKYVQSIIGDTYKQAKEFLDRGTLVYFSGTPCQIGGLYSYLNKEYDNLITQDIICHGVPSKKIWNKHLECRKKQIGADKVSSIAFKDKRTGWETYSVAIKFENGKEYASRSSKDNLMRAYLANLCLRPSCYNCKFKTKNRQSDITLADLWGAKSITPQLYDNKGTSLVIIGSERGKMLFEEISNSLTYTEIDLDEAIKYNSSMIASPPMPKKRDSFMLSVEKEDFDKVVERYCKPTLKQRIKRLIKKILKRK